MKLKRKNSQGIWESVAPSQKEFDDFKNDLTAQLADMLNDSILKNKGVSVAHRGMSGIAPENTVPAFELAGQYGFFGIETDLKQTSDGELVLYHDADVSTLTEGTGSIESKTFAEVRSLTITKGSRASLFPNTKIATLEEYLQIAVKYNLRCFVEVSSLSLVGTDKALDLIYKYGMQYNTVILGAPVHLNYIRTKDKNIALIYVTFRAVTEDDLNYCATIKPCAMGVGASSGYLTKDYVKLAHSKGVAINSYIINSYKDYFNNLDWGVDIITSDFIIGGVSNV